MSTQEFETGTCTYTVKFRVYSRTSGTELQGPAETLAVVHSFDAAEEYLTKAGFEHVLRFGTHEWVANSGYTRGYIERFVEYSYT